MNKYTNLYDYQKRILARNESEIFNDKKYKFKDPILLFNEIDKINNKIKRIKESHCNTLEDEEKEKSLFNTTIKLPPLLKNEVTNRVNDLLKTKYNDKNKYNNYENTNEDNYKINEQIGKFRRKSYFSQFIEPKFNLKDNLKLPIKNISDLNEINLKEENKFGIEKKEDKFKIRLNLPVINQITTQGYSNEMNRIVDKIHQEFPFETLKNKEIVENKKVNFNKKPKYFYENKNMNQNRIRRPKLTDLIISEAFYNISNPNMINSAKSSQDDLNKIIDKFSFDEKIKYRLDRCNLLSKSTTQTRKAITRFRYLASEDDY